MTRRNTPYRSTAFSALPAAARLLCAALLASPLAQAAEVLVDSNADSVGNDGVCTLREALDNSDAQTALWTDCAGDFGPDHIRFLPGLDPIVLTRGLDLTRPVVIEGPSGGQVIQAAPGMIEQLMRLTPAEDGAFRLENLILEGARHAAPGFQAGCANKGGALCIYGLFADVEVVLRGMTFRDNRVTNLVPANITGGGALFVDLGGSNSSVRIEDSLFQNNRLTDDDGDASAGYGGALLALSPVTVSGSLFVNNLSVGLFTGRGGAIHAFGGDLTLSKSTFDSNASSTLGAAVDTSLSNLLVVDSVFEFNGGAVDVLSFSGGAGGAQFLTLANTQLSNNSSRALTISGQGALFASLSGTTISANQVADRVAGLYATGAQLSISASTLADNVSTHGGDSTGASTSAMLIEDSTLLLEDSSVIGNDTFAAPGAGASGIEAIDSQLTIRNSALGNTQFGEGNLWRRGSSLINMSHSLLTPPDAAGEINGVNSNNAFTAVAFGLLGDYGCATPIGHLGNRCVLMRPHNGFAAALIDTGSSGSAFDQRGPGFPRNVGGGADIGAFELQAPRVGFATPSVTVTEGNTGTTSMSFILRRSGDLRGTTQVSWEVQGSGPAAVDASDFGSASLPFGSVFFDVDEREATITLSLQADAVVESDETFRVLLTQIIDGQADDPAEASGTVLNDDAVFVAPTLSLSPLSIDQPEGSLGFYSTHRFRITRTQDTSGFCTFALDLAGAGIDPIEASDLFSAALGRSGTIQLAPGEVSADFEVRIAADSEFEADETFSLTLAEPSGCFINQNARTVFSRVLNDDSLFALQASATTLDEGDAGATEFAFTVQRTGAAGHTATVSWSVTGSGGAAADALDFTGGTLPSGRLSFPPGVISLPITVSVAGDTAQEADEGFTVQLGNPRSGGSIDPLNASRSGLIGNDDVPPLGDTIFASGFEQVP